MHDKFDFSHVYGQFGYLASNPDHPIHALVLKPPVFKASQAVLYKTEPRLIQECLVGIARLPPRSVGIPAKERRALRACLPNNTLTYMGSVPSRASIHNSLSSSDCACSV